MCSSCAEVVEKEGICHPFSKESKMAGKDWLHGFFLVTQATGKESGTRSGVQQNESSTIPSCIQVLEMHPFTPARVWNMDETGIINVQTPGKIVATKGVRQVVKMTSGERGATVTVICAMSAAGAYLLPMFRFPRKRMVAAQLH